MKTSSLPFSSNTIAGFLSWSPELPELLQSPTIQISLKGISSSPEPFVTFKVYGSFESFKSARTKTAVSWVALFLVIESVLTVAPPFSGTKVTTAPVVSYKEPDITNVKLPAVVLSTPPDVTEEPPSIVKFVIVGGLSMDFHSVPV